MRCAVDADGQLRLAVALLSATGLGGGRGEEGKNESNTMGVEYIMAHISSGSDGACLNMGNRKAG